VDAYGAAGDGSTDDFDAISAAIAAAGEGGAVQFNPSKTYLSCKVLKPLKNQTIDFRGATLKKCDEVLADVSSYEGDGIWVLDDASGFEVGMWLSVSSTGGYDITTGPIEITAISGDTLTTWLSIQDPLAGSKMSSDSPFFHVVNSGVTISNFVFDGNYPNNGSILKWDTSILMLISGRNTNIIDGSVSSIPGDVLRFASGSDGSNIRNITATDGAGVFAHISGVGIDGTRGINIIGNDISDLGQEFERQEHALGAIEWSFDVGDVLVSGNTFSDLPFAAVNMTDDPLASEVIIQNNTATNTNGFLNFWKYQVDSSPSSSQKTMISGNRLENTKGNYISVGDIEESISEAKLLNNVGENTYWVVKGVEDFEYRNNDMIVNDLSAAGVGTDFDFFFSPATLAMKAVRSAMVIDNYFEGGWRQISFDNAGMMEGFGYRDQYRFDNNQFRDFLYSGLQGRASANGVGGNNEEVDWASNDNEFRSSVLGNGVSVSPSGKAFILPAGGRHNNNCVFISSDNVDTFAAEVYGLTTAGSVEAGGKLFGNVFANQNGRAAQWGQYDQVQSVTSQNSVVTDNISIGFLNANNGFEVGTIVDAKAVCDLPNKSFLSRPGDGANDVDPTPRFTWSMADLASAYQIQISKDDNFNAIAFDSLTVDTTSIDLGQLDLATEYFWRVRAVNNRGSSDWTNVRRFTVISTPFPTAVSLKSPVSGSSGRDIPVQLEWIEADFADKYQLQVALDENFSATKFDANDISSKTFSLGNDVLEDSTTYYWRVRGTNSQGNSPAWSETWSFRTTAIGVLPSIVDLAFPQNNADSQDPDLILRWRIADNTSTYKFQVTDDESFSSIIHDVTVADTLYDPTGLTMGKDYWWRVRGESSQGLSPDWSPIWKFSTAGGIPSNVTLSAPADGTIDVSTDLQLEWNRSSNSLSYQVQLATDQSFSSIAQNVTVPTDTTFNLAGLNQNTDYYWRVRGVNPQGQSPSWSPAWKFTTVTGVSTDGEFPEETEIQVYPNPVSNRLFIALGTNRIQDARIYNTLGRIVMHIDQVERRSNIEIDTSSLARGTYFIEFRDDEGRPSIFPIAVVR